MSKPIFYNDKSFPIQVGTPSGAGRIINPGFAVEGNYFSGPVSRGMPLRRLSLAEVQIFDKQKILVSLDETTPGVMAEAIKPYLPPPPADEEVADAAAVREEAKTKPSPDATNKTMEQSLDQAMKEMGTQIPTLAELKKMNMQELNACALKHGVSKANGRADIINQLAAKLSL